MSRWVDCGGERAGDVRYLVKTVNNSERGRESWSLRDTPLRTNRSHEPRLAGWCGETDNRSRFAYGVVRVVKTNVRGDRAMVAQVRGEELRVFLEGDGYPELIPDEAA